MSYNYGPCQVCGKDMVINCDDEGPHTLHEESCFFRDHFEDCFDPTDFDKFEEELEDVDCHCEPMECHPYCCPICSELSYSTNERFSKKKDSTTNA